MNPHKAVLNHGLNEYQNEKRKSTLLKIDAALHSLDAKHLPITKAAIADEIGCSRQALQKKYVSDYLSLHPLYNGRKVQSDTSEENQSTSFLKIELEKEKQKRRELEAKVKKLAQKNEQQKNELRDLNRKYQKLLGRYQEDIGRKIIHF